MAHGLHIHWHLPETVYTCEYIDIDIDIIKEEIKFLCKLWDSSSLMKLSDKSQRFWGKITVSFFNGLSRHGT